MSDKGLILINDLPFSAFASAAEVGFDNIYAEAAAKVAASNELVTNVLSDIVEPTTMQGKVWGNIGGGGDEQVSELGVPSSQKAEQGLECDFPLLRYAQNVSWSKVAWQTKPAQDLLKEIDGGRIRSNNTVLKALRNAIFNDGNYTFTDALGTNVSLSVKRFLNNDSAVIPDSPAGTEFAGTHNHYIARASTLARTDFSNGTHASGVISTVLEHESFKDVRMYVNSGDVASVQALVYDGSTNTQGYVPSLPRELVAPATVARATAGFPDTGTEDTLVGYWVTLEGPAVPVFVASWVPRYYILVLGLDGIEKPICMRQRPQTNLQGLRIEYTAPDFATVPMFLVREYGFGVFNRAAGAVLYINGTSWADPSLTGGGFYGVAGCGTITG